MLEIDIEKDCIHNVYLYGGHYYHIIQQQDKLQ